MNTSAREASLRQIELLRCALGIRGRGRRVHLRKPPGPDAVEHVLRVTNHRLNSSLNTRAPVSQFGSPPVNGVRYYYGGPKIPGCIDLFLTRMGILSDEILVPDPIADAVADALDGGFAPSEISLSWLKYIVEQSLYLVSLQDWVEEGIVTIVPPLRFWSSDGEQAAKADAALLRGVADPNLAGVEARLSLPSRYLLLTLSLEARALVLNKIDDDLRDFCCVQNAQQEKQLMSAIISGDDRQSNAVIVDIIVRQTQLARTVVEDFVAKQSRMPFRFPIRQQYDIETAHAGGSHPGFVIRMPSDPPSYAFHAANRLNAIPAYDDEGDWLAASYWSQWGNGEAAARGTTAQHGILSLPLDVPNDVPLDYILEVRAKGRGSQLREYLATTWSELADVDSEDAAQDAVQRFHAKVLKDYRDFHAEWADMAREARLKFGAAGITGLGSIAGAILTGGSLWWVAALAATGKGIEIAAQTSRELNRMRRNPLYVLLRLEQGQPSL
ncbi:MAG: hypothetical protein ABFE07_05900 [Armatimonadia bacterium]